MLGAQASQLFDPAGKLVCTVWFRSEIPVDATPEQIKNGLTYREVKQSEIIGAVRFEEDYRDYRKQKVKAGTYTLRLGYQPMDGDHAGASEFQDFLLVLDAAKDTNTDLLEAKALIETSAKSIASGHPGVFMLFPNNKPGQAPALTAMPKNHWVLQTKADATVGGKKTGTALRYRDDAGWRSRLIYIVSRLAVTVQAPRARTMNPDFGQFDACADNAGVFHFDRVFHAPELIDFDVIVNRRRHVRIGVQHDARVAIWCRQSQQTDGLLLRSLGIHNLDGVLADIYKLQILDGQSG